MSSKRVYGDEEISRILKRAAEIQTASGTGETYGLTLEELQQVAQEAGIDPAHVAAATVELEQGGATEQTFHWLGGPTSLSVARVVEGAVMEDQQDELLAEIRRTFDVAGTFSKVGQMLEWTHYGIDEQMQVTMTSRGERTELRVFWKYPRTKRLAFMPAMLGAFFVAMNLIIPLSSVGLASWMVGLLLGTFVAAVFMAARLGFSHAVQKRERKAQHLLDRLQQIIPASERISENASARIDTALLDEEMPDAAVLRSASTRRETTRR